MTLRLYMDEHVSSAITEGLRNRSVEVLTAQEDGQTGASDPQLLARATQLDRVLFTRDSDFLAEAAALQKVGQFFRESFLHISLTPR